MTRPYFLAALAAIVLSTIFSPVHAGLVGQIDFNMNGQWFVAGNGTQSSVDIHFYGDGEMGLFLDWSFYDVTPADIGKVYVMPESLTTNFVSLMTNNSSNGLDLRVGGAMAAFGEDSIWNYDGFLPLKGSVVHPDVRSYGIAIGAPRRGRTKRQHFAE